MIRSSKLRPLSGRSFTSRSSTTPEICGRGGIHQQELLRRNGHLLREIAHFKLQVHHRFLPHLQIDAGANGRLETLSSQPSLPADLKEGPQPQSCLRHRSSRSRAVPVSRLVTVTVAPLTAAPDASSTRPEIAPGNLYSLSFGNRRRHRQIKSRLRHIAARAASQSSRDSNGHASYCHSSPARADSSHSAKGLGQAPAATNPQSRLS